MRIALDADVCVYSATQTPWTSAVRERIAGASLLGSVVLAVELLPKPMRQGALEEGSALKELLRRVELIAVTLPLAALATTLATDFGLRAVDAIHLATAVHGGADVFYTNNRRDFSDVAVDGLVVEFPVASGK